MESTNSTPETLLQAIQHFSDPDVALAFMIGLRWPNGVTCPHCSGAEVTFMASRRVWQCRAKACRKQFSAKVGTIFEDSPIGLDRWLPCLWMLVNCKNGISSYEVARDLGVTQKTAWFMLHRIRLAMQAESFGKFGGTVEADETYIGGKARNMHPDKRARVGKPGRSLVGKVAVMGLLERHGNNESQVRTKVLNSLKGPALKSYVRENVEPGSTLNTDAFNSYRGLIGSYTHNVINHAETYVRGTVHTNGVENFWSLLKRGIKGTYVSVEPFHLFRYLDEQAFRFNNRKDDDAGRFMDALRNVVGKRVTYKALIGAGLPETC
jgi:transposase-like protein